MISHSEVSEGLAWFRFFVSCVVLVATGAFVIEILRVARGLREGD